MDKVLKDYLLKESTGSGSHPHAGRPGHVGGSSSGSPVVNALIPISLSKYRALVRKQGLYVVMYPGNTGRNWDGTWWHANWSDGNSDQVKISATKRFNGLSYCRTKAKERAFTVRAKSEGYEIIQ